VFVACRQGQTATAQRWAGTMTKLTTALFRKTSPVPLKYALSLLGLISPKVRLPLVELTDTTKFEVAAVKSQRKFGRLCDRQKTKVRISTRQAIAA
jgi:4-hydroxy-tetrahydrodipicolinate synthase